MGRLVFILFFISLLNLIVGCDKQSVAMEDESISIEGESSSSTMGMFLDSNSFLDPRDAQIYRYTEIGDQVWMAENLDYSGDDGLGQRTYSIGFCLLEDNENSLYRDSTTCKTVGRRYTWYEAMFHQRKTKSALTNDEKGVCPPGWHLPTHAEWQILAEFISLDSDLAGREYDYWPGVGNMLKSTSGWGEGAGVDHYNFSAVGEKYSVCADWDCSSIQNLYFSYWWSASDLQDSYDTTYSSAYIWQLRDAGDYFSFRTHLKVNNFTVRCVLDEKS